MEMLQTTRDSLGVAVSESSSPVPVEELVRLCALNTELYCHTFFPLAFRSKSPPFHKDVDRLLDNASNRHVAVEVFRGGAKTTKLRAFASKRIAYGTSRTIMIVSSSQDHAKRSVGWLRTAIRHNKSWTTTFGLSAGRKWTDEYIEIEHASLGHTIAVIAVGITGQIRGVNIDDHRPDLIIVDDPDNEETTATPEQRKKTRDLFFGAVEKSLVPALDNPEAKMVLLQTSLHKEDLINRCHIDPQWATLKFGCFADDGNSQWPAMWARETLEEDKRAHIVRGDTLLWLREMECKIGDEETAYFKREWIKFWDTLPERMVCVIAIDPAPPPSELQVAKGFRDKDYEVLSVWGYAQGKFYALEISASRGHEPEWTINEFFRLVDKWKPLKARVEGNAYQRTLKWLLEKEMQNRKRWLQINAEPSTRKKHHRIRQAFSGMASAGNMLVSKDMVDFVSQFSAYPNLDHDDILDASALAVEELLELGPAMGEHDFDMVEDAGNLGEWRAAP